MSEAVITENLTKKFGEFTAVNNISLTIPYGQIYGILGPNGAGKSTFIKMLCGLLEPSSGKGLVAGYDLDKDTEKIKQCIGYMSQKFSLYEDLTVWENLDFYGGIYNIPITNRKKRIKEMLNLANLQEERNALVKILPPGLRQRLALVSAILSKPKILFLDEPTSGVSPIARKEFFNIIQGVISSGTTVIITTHFMDEAQRCHQIGFISEGKLIANGTPDNLKQDTIKEYMVSINSSAPMKLLLQVEKLPYVKDCSVHGTEVHILLQDATYKENLHNVTGCICTEISPSLEDVFIYLARSSRKAG